MGGDDYAIIDLNSAAFDLSDRGVTGLPHPGPLDAYVWMDRGIYRPGETVHVMTIVRDDAGRPSDIPVHVIIKRPNGQIYLDASPARADEASIHLPVALSSGAPAGNWSIEVKADPGLPPIGTGAFRVDAFVPDRWPWISALLPVRSCLASLTRCRSPLVSFTARRPPG